jgi:nitrogen-specific signal transduction histidine kinase
MNNPEQIYENIFNSIIDGVLLVSPSMTVQKSNLTVEDMFHRSSDSFINQGLSRGEPKTS